MRGLLLEGRQALNTERQQDPYDAASAAATASAILSNCKETALCTH